MSVAELEQRIYDLERRRDRYLNESRFANQTGHGARAKEWRIHADYAIDELRRIRPRD